MATTTGTATTINRTQLRDATVLRNGSHGILMLARQLFVAGTSTDKSIRDKAIGLVAQQLVTDTTKLEAFQDTTAVNALLLRKDTVLPAQTIIKGCEALLMLARKLVLAQNIKDQPERVAWIMTAIERFIADPDVLEAAQNVAALSDNGLASSTPTTGQPAATATPSPGPTGMPVTPLTPNLGNAATTRP